MTLIHYAFAPVTLEQRTVAQSVDLKPSGLWVSDGAEWLDWCRSEEFRTDKPWFSHEVTLTPEAEILTLASAEGIRTFTRRYGRQITPGLDSHRIAWDEVAADYDGILITPYQWSCRNGTGTFWYYGWDVASGCIWNTDVISLGEAVEVSLAEVTS